MRQCHIRCAADDCTAVSTLEQTVAEREVVVVAVFLVDGKLAHKHELLSRCARLDAVGVEVAGVDGVVLARVDHIDESRECLVGRCHRHAAERHVVGSVERDHTIFICVVARVGICVVENLHIAIVARSRLDSHGVYVRRTRNLRNVDLFVVFAAEDVDSHSALDAGCDVVDGRLDGCIVAAFTHGVDAFLACLHGSLRCYRRHGACLCAVCCVGSQGSGAEIAFGCVGIEVVSHPEVVFSRSGGFVVGSDFKRCGVG